MATDNYTIMKDVHDRMDKQMEIEEDRKIRETENKDMRRHNYIIMTITIIGSGIMSLIVSLVTLYFSK